ncbi:MAG: type II toxin-antitoxin system VapC family toxin [Acidimicrobiales bacterium]
MEVAVSSVTLAELAAGPRATDDPAERSRRQDRLQRTEATFDPLPFDADAARAYGRVFSAITQAGHKPRGARAVDLLIAATALSAQLPLYTRNPDDFRALDDLIDVVAIQPRAHIIRLERSTSTRAADGEVHHSVPRRSPRSWSSTSVDITRWVQTGLNLVGAGDSNRPSICLVRENQAGIVPSQFPRFSSSGALSVCPLLPSQDRCSPSTRSR